MTAVKQKTSMQTSPEREGDGPKRLILCAGLQSSGSTLISWCFLQRADTDGMLDLECDRLRPCPDVHVRNAWVKMTISSFRWGEVAEYYRWFGFNPQPLLIVRDVRDVYASLRIKRHGLNSVTAEDPPLRMRLQRFLEDWRMFRENGWPILRYEDVISDGESALKSACQALSLSWDRSMIDWDKPSGAIADIGFGSPSFHASRGAGGLHAVLGTCPASAKSLPRRELEWLEATFRQFNEAEGYPLGRGDFVTSDESGMPEMHLSGRTLLEQCEQRLDACGHARQHAESDLVRIQRHPVFGRLLRLWSRFVNPTFPAGKAKRLR